MMAAPFAAMDGLPILFTEGDNISQQALDVLKSLNIKSIEIIGGYDIVSSQAEDELIKMGIGAARTAGVGVTGTNIEMIRKHMPFPDSICIARDDLFADSLSGVPYGAKLNAPILLVDSSNVNNDINSFISPLLISKVFVFGGTGAVSDDVVNSICRSNSSGKFYGINFSPYIDGQDPNTGSNVSEDQIRSRMKVIAPYTMWIRTYGCTVGVEGSGRIAREFGLKAALGAWIGRDYEANRKEISSLIEEIKSGDADMAIVGNEVLLRGDVTEEELIGYIKEVRDAARASGVHIPVSAVETYSELLKHPKLMEVCDVILVNYHPYWEGKDIRDAVSSLAKIIVER